MTLFHIRATWYTLSVVVSVLCACAVVYGGLGLVFVVLSWMIDALEWLSELM